MPQLTPENRPQAPGALGVVQEFLNSENMGFVRGLPAGIETVVAARHAAGQSIQTIAADLDLRLGVVSAFSRGILRADSLENGASARRWLVSHGLLANGVPVSDDEARSLRDCRELLRRLAEGNSEKAATPEIISELNLLARRAPVAVAFGGEPHLTPGTEGALAAMSRVLAIVYDAMRDGTWQRLKRCPGLGCPATFYDTSRNRTGTWCAMSICGNRTKVRNYQARRRVRPTA
jgi:predicted RNA-binding Zn ribbon-like protein